MFRVPLVTSDIEISQEHFWNSVFLYHTSPHLINRRLLGVSQLYFLRINLIKDEIYKVKDILKYSELYSQIYSLKSISKEVVNETIITNILEQNGIKYTCEKKEFDCVRNSIDGTFVSVRLLLPRNVKSKSCVEVVILDKNDNLASFLAVWLSNEHSIIPNFLYDIELDKSNLMKICVSDIETAELKASEWLSDVLFPKLINWTTPKPDATSVPKSLSLITVDEYCYLYHQLKLKYGDQITKNWPENTDPLKFVYEDIAIASYLLILWQRFTPNVKKQKFVDLGCGNGLLVHILSQEGHNGYGIDVRARKIWNMYPDTTKLKIQTIIPSSKHLFPEADWIIGNHSDELTPWIPVIAARSSQKCNYFLLPCCSYEFNGKKYQRTNSGQSQYHDYLNYIQSVSDTCGFKTEIDRLRIPSTKRICLIGTERLYNDFTTIDQSIMDKINERCGGTTNMTDSNTWINDYQAREVVETVRNCTKLDKNLIECIVTKIVSYLLSESNYIQSSSGSEWNTGGVVTLAELVKIIPKELKQLKNECGGLQTLLKNHHYIFVVQNGSVRIRIPIVNDPNKKYEKRRKCWFFEKHPNGCLLDADSCSYLH